MVTQTSISPDNKKTKQKKQATNSVLKYDAATILKEDEEPVVKLKFKSFLDEMFGFIKVGGDLG